MTVQELIRRLASLNPDATVVIEAGNDWVEDVAFVGTGLATNGNVVVLTPSLDCHAMCDPITGQPLNS